MLMPSFPGIPIAQAASAGDELQGSMKHAGVESVRESLVHVADFPEFVFDPARFDFFLVPAERGRRRIVFDESLESSLGGEHPALNREMNSLEARGVDEAC